MFEVSQDATEALVDGMCELVFETRVFNEVDPEIVPEAGRGRTKEAQFFVFEAPSANSEPLAGGRLRAVCVSADVFVQFMFILLSPII